MAANASSPHPHGGHGIPALLWHGPGEPATALSTGEAAAQHLKFWDYTCNGCEQCHAHICLIGPQPAAGETKEIHRKQPMSLERCVDQMCSGCPECRALGPRSTRVNLERRMSHCCSCDFTMEPPSDGGMGRWGVTQADDGTREVWVAGGCSGSFMWASGERMYCGNSRIRTVTRCARKPRAVEKPHVVAMPWPPPVRAAQSPPPPASSPPSPSPSPSPPPPPTATTTGHETASGHADGHQHGGHAHGKPPDSECRSFCAAKLDGGANGKATCKWKACAACPECIV